MRTIKLTIPVLLAFLFGLFGFAIQYTAHPWASDTKELISQWSVIIGGVAWVLGTYSLTRLHVDRVRKKEEGWGYSIFFFIGFGVVALASIHNGGRWFLNAQVTERSLYQWLYDALYVPAGATMFSLLGFFIASAAVRTFRARSVEATLLLIAAIIVMLGRVPLGEMISGYFPRLTDWLMKVPNTAARRGILMGVSLGMIAMSLRIIFGIERTYLGGRD
jgi:hypothetical protein